MGIGSGYPAAPSREIEIGRTDLAMRALIATMITLCQGCLYLGWDDIPTATVRVEISEQHAANTTFDNRTYWWGQIAVAVATWNQAAVEHGCEAPFQITADGTHPIYLVPVAEWQFGEAIGMYHDEYEDDVGTIYIRERRPVTDHIPTLLHELGHAIGLDHDDAADSVMTDRVERLLKLGPSDVERMRSALGC